MVWLLEGDVMACISTYDKKITIQTLAGTADAHGFIDNTLATNWATYETAFASVQSKGGREYWKVQQVAADVTHVWKCQYSAALATATPDMRLIHSGATYQILSIEDVDLAHYEIEIRTKRAV